MSPATTGSDELGRYGNWTTLPDSEAVWFPAAVPADWAPYRFGHWVSIPPWGWTWVDDEPWGFAPFHYGRWVNVDGRWGWVPGPVTPDPVYAPALVAFVDPNGGAAAGPAGPDIGWFPLGPGDPYVPWYAAGPAYVERVNVVNVVAVQQRADAVWRTQYVNRRYATAVSRDAFAGGRPVHVAIARIPPDRLTRAPVMRGAPHVVPAIARTVPNPGVGNARAGVAGGRETAAEARGGAPRALQGRQSEAVQGPARHGGALRYARPEAAAGRTEPYRGGQQFAQPGTFRGGQQQFAQPGAFRGGQQQFAQPGAFRGGQQPFAQPGAFRGGQQFAQSGAFRGGRQFASPGAFRTPAPALGARNVPMMGRAAPQLGRPAAPQHVGGAAPVTRHK